MAKKKVHSGSKGHKRHKHRRHHRKGFLGNVGTMGHELVETGTNVGLIIASAWGTMYGLKKVDEMIGFNGHVAGAFDYKSLITPVVGLAAGVATAHFGKGNSMVKHIGYGIATGGVLHGVTNVSGTQLLAGTEVSGANYFRETEQAIQALKNANVSRPQVNGWGYDPVTNQSSII